ncbi:rCG49338, partial [Rattus norvegicus]
MHIQKATGYLKYHYMKSAHVLSVPQQWRWMCVQPK